MELNGGPGSRDGRPVVLIPAYNPDGRLLDLLARLISTQLVTKGEKHLLDHNRTYFKLLRTIIAEGRDSGEFTMAFSVNDIVKAYALAERALMYDWCLVEGEYSLSAYSTTMMPMFLNGFRK